MPNRPGVRAEHIAPIVVRSAVRARGAAHGQASIPEEKHGDVFTDGTLIKYENSVTMSREYQSVTVTVGVVWPCELRDAPKAFNTAVLFVEDRLAQQVADGKQVLLELVRDAQRNGRGR